MTDWPEEVVAVYVLCHPTKEPQRWARLEPHLLNIGIPAEKIRVCAPTWGTDLRVKDIFNVYDPFLQRRSGKKILPPFTFKAAGLTRGEISLALNFTQAVHDVIKREEKGLVITLESDVWLRKDFVPRLKALIASAATVAPSWDYISLGEGVGTRPAGAEHSYYAASKAYKPPHDWVFRCTDSMLFTTDYLERLSKTMIPFKEIIDWEMNFQLLLNKGTALWADPPLAEQGTCFQRMVSSLPA
jgi:hypothetical protein